MQTLLLSKNITNEAKSIITLQEASTQSDFQRLEFMKGLILNKVEIFTYRSLVETFNDAKDELEKQAVIEAAQELGFIDLAIEMIEGLN